MFPSSSTCFKHDKICFFISNVESMFQDIAIDSDSCEVMFFTKNLPASLPTLSVKHDETMIGNRVFAAMFFSLNKI